jgi:preprotein translocase subunit SecA
MRRRRRSTNISEEAFGLFERMLVAIRENVTQVLSYIQLSFEQPELPKMPDFITTHIDPLTGEDDSADIDGGDLGLVTTRLPPLQMVQPDMVDELGEDPADWEGQVSRNAPCPCGSGQKYKHCHGAL